MKNQRGFAEVAVLYGIIAIMALLFIPNPVGKVLGVGVQPNKIIQKESHTEALVPIDPNCPSCGFKRVSTDTTTDNSVQEHVTFLQWLSSLPIIVLVLMGIGVLCPPVAVWLHKLNQTLVDDFKELKGDSKKIVAGVEMGLMTIDDPAKKQAFLDAMSKMQDSTTKSLVAELKRL